MRHPLFSLLGIQRVSATRLARRRKSGFSPAMVEALEIRQLLAANVRLLPNTTGEVGTLTDVNGKLFFVNGGQIAISDGREDGTRQVSPGASGFAARELTNVGGTLFYGASIVAGDGPELWKSNGTAAGTSLVKDIRPGAVGSALGELTDVGGTLFFFANDGITGVELWKSDGTAAGTVLVKDIRPGISDSLPRNLTNVGGTLYFRANDGISGPELWRSDGTTNGTVLVQDSVPGINGLNPSELTEVNGTLFYTTSQVQMSGLWKTDGTDAGTSLVKNFVADNSYDGPRELTDVAGTLYFRAGRPGNVNNVDIWKSDGTPVGTVFVADIGDAIGVGGLNTDHSFTNFDGTLIFKRFFQLSAPAVWKTDGTGPGTVAVASNNFNTSFQNGFPQSLPIPVHNGFFYFDSEHLLLQQSDGTSVTPVIGINANYDTSFVSVGDSLYFLHGGVLASLNEISSPTIVTPSTVSTVPRPMISWTSVPGATSYNVVVTDRTRGVDNFFTATVAGTSLIPNMDFGLGNFSVSVRVASTLIVGQQSNWSDSLVFESRVSMAPPIIGRLQSTARPTILWSPLQGASQYDLLISNMTTGQSQFIRETISTGTSFTPSSDLPMGVYRASISGRSADGVIGLFSSATEFIVVPAPTVIGPLNSTFSRQPTFSWNAVTGAAKYELVLRNANNGQVVHSVPNLLVTHWAPPADLPVGTYRWQVVAVSSDGYRSQAPQVITFFVGGRTDVLSPTGTTSDRTPTFSWRPVDGAASYQIQVDRRDVAVIRIINETSLLATTQYTPTTPLPVGTFRVWVRAIGTFGELGLWSPPVDFQVTQTSETLNDSLIAVLPTDDVLSVVLDGRQEHRSTPRTIVVSNDPRSDESVDVFVAEAEFVARQPVTIDRTATRTDKEHAERIHDGILDRLMASQGEADDLTWMF